MPRRSVSVGVHKLAIDSHLVNLLETERIVVEIGFPEAPSVREDEVLEFGAELAEAVVYRFERTRYVLGLVLSLDLLQDVEAVFKEGRAYCLGGRYDASWTEEFSIDSLPIWWSRSIQMSLQNRMNTRVDLAKFFGQRLELGSV